MTLRPLLNALKPFPTSSRSIPELDGFRTLAVMGVVTLHLLQTSHLGWVRSTIGGWSVLGTGVQMFFVLSGFLLFLPYARHGLGGASRPSTRLYFERRALRILPAYWAALTIFVLVQRPTSRHGLLDVGLHAALLHDLLRSTLESINPPFWTLAVEMHFYLLLPLIAVAVLWALQPLRPARLAVVAATILVVSASGYALSLGSNRAFPSLHRFVTAPSVLQHLPVFGVGITASLVYVAATEGCWAMVDLSRRVRVLGAAGLALAGLAVLASQTALYSARYGYIVTNQLMGLAYGSIMLGSLLGFASWRKVLSRPLFRFVGMVSYSVYIWNLIIIKWVARHSRSVLHNEFATFGVTVVLGLLITFLVSITSYLVFERPFFPKRREIHLAAVRH